MIIYNFLTGWSMSCWPMV